MKTLSWFRVALLGSALWLTLAAAAHAQQDEPFKVVSIRPTWSKDLIKVGSAWRKDLPKRIQVSLRVAADTPSAGLFVKAYFYDKDDKLIETADKPNLIWTATPKGLEEVGLPATLSHAKPTDVYFAITENVQQKNWTTVLVVFGNASTVTATALPGSELAKVAFPEKARITPPIH